MTLNCRVHDPCDLCKGGAFDVMLENGINFWDRCGPHQNPFSRRTKTRVRPGVPPLVTFGPLFILPFREFNDRGVFFAVY